MIASALDRAIKAACPIHGVSIGRLDDKATWRIDFKDEATDEERAAAQGALDAFDPDAVPVPDMIEGAAFLGRVTDDEYAATLTLAQSNAQVARWLDILRMRGEIDVNGNTARAAKAGLVQLGVLTSERADAIFAPLST